MDASSDRNSLESTSIGLIAALRINDEAAWHRFVNLYGPLIYAWCRRAQVSQSSAADLVQQVFAKVLTGIQGFQYRRDTDSFRAWLWTITQNVLRDWQRGQGRHPGAMGGTSALDQLQQVPDQYPPQSSVVSDGRSDLVRRAYEQIKSEFPAHSLRAFELLIFDGCNATETARIVGQSPDAVRKAKSRILHRLRQAIGEIG